MPVSVRTLCRSCSAACGIVVDVERGGASGEDRVLRVRGDAANRRSQGYLCPKGASLPDFHHRATRLERPRLRGRPATWDETLDDLAARLDRLRRAGGPDAIALYQGTGAVSDSLALPAIGRFVAGLGTRQLYTAATVDVAPALRAGELVAGFAQPWPVWRPEDPDGRLALLIGFNPALSHGYLTLLPNATERLRAYRARGGALWVADPRRTRTARLADHHLAPRPGSDAILLAWLVRQALGAARDEANGTDRARALARCTTAADRDALARALAPLTLERVTNETGLPGASIEALVQAIRAAGRIAVVAGTGIMLGRDALLCEWLRWALLIATDSLDRAGGMAFDPGVLTRFEQTGVPIAPPEGWIGPGPRSRPELPRLLDQHPCVALVDEIEAGNVRALFVAGSSPLTAFPEPERLRRAFARLDALVVLDVAETPLAAMATHVLPATGQLERTDLVVETQAAIAPAVVPPVASRRPMWWILAALAARLGFDGLGEGLTPDRTRDEDLVARAAASARGGAAALLAAGPDGIDPTWPVGWIRERVLPEGRFRLVPPGLLDRLQTRIARPPATAPFRLIAARQRTRTNATPYMSPARSPDAPRLALHPEDARTLGVDARDAVEITSASGKLVAPVALDPDLLPGTVSLAHGWFETNVCALTSSRDDVDPLTGQPSMTGLPVRIARVATPGRA
ncbi:MAG: molybdopterin-dependent oxidoreductase [Myxococcota bacterium]